MTVNDKYKIKLWNIGKRACVKTCLGPTYGGPIEKLKLISSADQSLPLENEGTFPSNYYVAYSTEEKVVGLIKLPIDGNPYKSMGMIGHPGKITDITCSLDGKFLFTSGGEDLCVNMWLIDTSYIEKNVMLGGEEKEPFL